VDVNVELRELVPDDAASIATYVELDNARNADSPWRHDNTTFRVEMALRHGWDGDPDRLFLVLADGEPVGVAPLGFSSYDNLEYAWVNALVHPDRRRQGIGTRAFEAVMAEARAMGRTKLGTDGWDRENTLGFAAAHGWERRASSVQRRQHLRELEPGLAESAYDEAVAHAGEYELVRIDGCSPVELLESIAVTTAAINDAPTDDLELEEEVFTGDRVRSFERAQADSGFRFRRILARHRDGGEIAGLTVATVDSERPWIGQQFETLVVRAHRGHRLGLLLKADMMRWLAEEEPQLETIDTWNAESNRHMIAVNDRLGYRPLGRTLEFQRRDDV
jgi:RimJ/RimL family protein N-acetyltransferase